MGVVGPVGGETKLSAGCQKPRRLGREGRVDQPAFAVPRFRPRIGEEDKKARQALVRQEAVISSRPSPGQTRTLVSPLAST